MAKVQLPSSVEAEIEAIGEHIAQDDVRAAIEMMRRIYSRCASLDFLPQRGSRYQKDYRRVLEGPFQIIYRVEEDEDETLVHIVTVHPMSRREPDLS